MSLCQSINSTLFFESVLPAISKQYRLIYVIDVDIENILGASKNALVQERSFEQTKLWR